MQKFLESSKNILLKEIKAKEFARKEEFFTGAFEKEAQIDGQKIKIKLIKQ